MSDDLMPIPFGLAVWCFVNSASSLEERIHAASLWMLMEHGKEGREKFLLAPIEQQEELYEAILKMWENIQKQLQENHETFTREFTAEEMYSVNPNYKEMQCLKRQKKRLAQVKKALKKSEYRNALQSLKEE